MKSEDALKDKDMRRIYGILIRKPGMLLERVDRNVDLFPLRVLAGHPRKMESICIPRLDVPQVIHQQVKVNGCW